MVKINRLSSAILLASLYLTQAGNKSCSGDLLNDSGFDLWCGDELCSWQVEKGTVEQAPTWHPDLPQTGSCSSVSKRAPDEAPTVRPTDDCAILAVLRA